MLLSQTITQATRKVSQRKTVTSHLLRILIEVLFQCSDTLHPRLQSIEIIHVFPGKLKRRRRRTKGNRMTKGMDHPMTNLRTPVTTQGTENVVRRWRER